MIEVIKEKHKLTAHHRFTDTYLKNYFYETIFG